MRTRFALTATLYTAVVAVLANSYHLIARELTALWVLIPVFLLVNVLAGTATMRRYSRALRVCHHGTVLLGAFCGSVAVSVLYHIVLAVQLLPTEWKPLLWSALVCIGVNAVVFWNGILCVYLTSSQLGVKKRVIGAVCGLIPVANVVALLSILKTTVRECAFETRREDRNRQRRQDKCCATRYPLLLVHGVFFRDTKYFNYWGRIPKELKANGATVFYGNQQSAASVADSAAELAARIDEILAQTGAEKVNVIAHSKGGLDCRYALSELGMAHRVASLTTVNTPHRGCLFADDLLDKIPAKTQQKIADTYNAALRKLGDRAPDFMAAVRDLTDEACQKRNAELPDPQGVYCQSIGTVLARASSGQFPLNLSYRLVRHYDGENDGLVSERSFAWGERYQCLRPTGERGISHADIIDLNRENIDEFDVREFYVSLVAELKAKGF